jgi:hypothetical protein
MIKADSLIETARLVMRKLPGELVACQQFHALSSNLATTWSKGLLKNSQPGSHDFASVIGRLIPYSPQAALRNWSLSRTKRR